MCDIVWHCVTGSYFLAGRVPFSEVLKVGQRDEGTIERCKLKTLQNWFARKCWMHMVQVFCAVPGMAMYGPVWHDQQSKWQWNNSLRFSVIVKIEKAKQWLHCTNLCFNWSLALLPASLHPWFPSAQYLVEDTGSEVSCTGFSYAYHVSKWAMNDAQTFCPARTILSPLKIRKPKLNRPAIQRLFSHKRFLPMPPLLLWSTIVRSVKISQFRKHRTRPLRCAKWSRQKLLPCFGRLVISLAASRLSRVRFFNCFQLPGDQHWASSVTRMFHQWTQWTSFGDLAFTTDHYWHLLGQICICQLLRLFRLVVSNSNLRGCCSTCWAVEIHRTSFAARCARSQESEAAKPS